MLTHSQQSGRQERRGASVQLDAAHRHSSGSPSTLLPAPDTLPAALASSGGHMRAHDRPSGPKAGGKLFASNPNTWIPDPRCPPPDPHIAESEMPQSDEDDEVARLDSDVWGRSGRTMTPMAPDPPATCRPEAGALPNQPTSSSNESHVAEHSLDITNQHQHPEALPSQMQSQLQGGARPGTLGQQPVDNAAYEAAWGLNSSKASTAEYQAGTTSTSAATVAQSPLDTLAQHHPQDAGQRQPSRCPLLSNHEQLRTSGNGSQGKGSPSSLVEPGLFSQGASAIGRFPDNQVQAARPQGWVQHAVQTFTALQQAATSPRSPARAAQVRTFCGEIHLPVSRTFKLAFRELSIQPKLNDRTPGR